MEKEINMFLINYRGCSFAYMVRFCFNNHGACNGETQLNSESQFYVEVNK